MKDRTSALPTTVWEDKSFTEFEMAVMCLRMMPNSYIDQYWLQNKFQPQEVATLRNCLEAISAIVSGEVRKRKEEQFEHTPKKANPTTNNNCLGSELL